MAFRTIVVAALLLTTSCGAVPPDPGAAGPPSSDDATSTTLPGRTPTTAHPPSAPSGCPAFILDLVSARDGQATPLAAVAWFRRNGGVDVELPGSGWAQVGRDATGVVLRSGRATLHVLEGPDGTWQVDSGSRC